MGQDVFLIARFCRGISNAVFEFRHVLTLFSESPETMD